MPAERITRRIFVRRAGVTASAIAVGSLISSRSASAATGEECIVGRYIAAIGGQAALIRDLTDRRRTVQIDGATYMTHGADGVVSGLDKFVPGEEVVVVTEEPAADPILATEMQSVYTQIVGTLQLDGEQLTLKRGEVIIGVPRSVNTNDEGLPPIGAMCSATVWTDPESGEAIAVDLVQAA